MPRLGYAILASLLASRAFGLPSGDTDSSKYEKTGTSLSMKEVEQKTPTKIDPNTQLPAVSRNGPAYSLLIAKETGPDDAEGVIVAWVYGNSFCTERQMLSRDIGDFCYKKLTFDRVPKLDEKLQATGDITEISGYLAGCSDDVSLGRSYEGLYWVEMTGMNDGVGDKPADDKSTSKTTSTKDSTDPKKAKRSSDTDSKSSDSKSSDTKSSDSKSSDEKVSEDKPTDSKPDDKSTASTDSTRLMATDSGDKTGSSSDLHVFKCNNDLEKHGCPRSSTSEERINSFVSCGQYAYTDKPGEPGSHNSGSDKSSSSSTSSSTTS